MSTNIYNRLPTCTPVLHVLKCIFKSSEIEAENGVVEMSFAGLANIMKENEGVGKDMIITYLYSGGYVSVVAMSSEC